MKLVSKAGLALVVVAAVVGCGGPVDKAGGSRSPAPVTLTMAASALEEIPPFVDEVGRVSGNSIRLDVVDGRSTGLSEAAMIRSVESGEVDLAVVPARAWHARGIKDFDALIAPMALDSLTVEQQVLASDVTTDMLASVNSIGLVGIGILPGPLRKPVGITRKLLGPADFRGLRIGFSESDVGARALQTLGATPVPSGFAGTSLAGMDGLEQQVTSVQSNLYDGMATTITDNVTLWVRPLIVVANGKKLAALDAAQVDTLRRAAQAAVRSTADLQQKLETDSAAVLCRRGKLQFVNASAAQLHQFHEAFAPVYSWLRQDTRTRSYLERIESLRAQLPAASTSDAQPCAGSEPPAATAASKLDGVYRTSFTKAELAASPLLYDQGEVNDDNWGNLTLTIKEGRVTLSRRDGGLDTGTCVVRADTVLLTFGTTGETFGFRWNLYRDTLTLRRDESLGPGPTPFLVKPWRRVG
ncbi:TRAP transporter substrate-binding protein [Kribbella sp. NPDC055071]